MEASEFERDLKDDLKLNRFGLEKEAERQADMFLYWSDQLAEAKFLRDKAKTKLGIITGERELDIRRNPPEGLKLTEGVVKAYVAQDPDIEAKQSKLDSANRRVNTLEGVVRALDHKKSQIDNLTRLSISGYYAKPGGFSPTQEAADNGRKNLNK